MTNTIAPVSLSKVLGMSAPPILINLDRRQEKLANANYQILHGGFQEVFRVSAVDGHLLDLTTLNLSVRMKRALQRTSAEVNSVKESESISLVQTRSQLGRLLSHRAIWAQMISNRLDRVIVFEDNVLLRPGFERELKLIWPCVPKSKTRQLFELKSNCDLTK